MRQPEPTPRQRGIWIALELHRRADPKTWRASVDKIEDPEARAAADDYLRGIIQRMKARAEAMRGKK